MNSDDLLKPAVVWGGETWAGRIDQCASMLYCHGYIPLSVREKIAAKLLKQCETAAQMTPPTSPKEGLMPPVNQGDGGVVERVAEAIYDFLDERFPGGAMPGGKQLFADDHLDAEFKHEAGCEELARAILQSLPLKEVREALTEAWAALAFLDDDALHNYGHIDGASMRDWQCAKIDAALSSLDITN